MRRVRTTRAAVVFFLAPLAATIAPVSAEEVTFSKHVAPILLEKCISCHNTRTAKGDFDVSSYQLLIDAVEKGAPEDSPVYYLLVHRSSKRRMPKEKDPLSAEAIGRIKKWIADGAKYDGDDPAAPLRAIVPREKQPAAPEVYPVPVPVAALTLSPKGDHVVAGGYHELTVWNANDGSLVRRIGGVGQRTHDLEFSPDGRLLAVAGGTPGKDGSVHLVDFARGSIVREIAVTPETAFGVAFRPDGKKLATAGGDGAVRIFDVATWKEEMVIRQHDDWAFAVAWNADGSRLVSASRDKTAKIYNAKAGEVESTYVGHENSVYRVTFAADGKHVWSSGADNNVRKWNSAPSLEREMSEKGKDPKTVAVIEGARRPVYAMDLKAGMVFSGSSDRSVRQHQATDQKHVRSYGGHADSVYSVHYHEGTKRLASGSYDGEVRVFDVESGKLVLSFIAAPGCNSPTAARKLAF